MRPQVSMDLKNNLDLNVYLLSTSAKSHKSNFRNVMDDYAKDGSWESFTEMHCVL